MLHQDQGLDTRSIISGIVLTLVVYGVLVVVLLYGRGQTARRPETIQYVNAELVRFGKPRDLSFLPHVQAQPKVAEKPKAIKVSDDPDRKVERKPEEKTEVDEKSLQAHKDLIRKMAEEDDRATQAALEEGQLNGVRGGTAARAEGDPFVLAVKGAITERWSVPTMLTPGELAKLKAAVCLKISAEGQLLEYKIVEPSGNTLFDGSLESTLGSIKDLTRPYGPFAKAALNGKLCAEFTKQ